MINFNNNLYVVGIRITEKPKIKFSDDNDITSEILYVTESPKLHKEYIFAIDENDALIKAHNFDIAVNSNSYKILYIEYEHNSIFNMLKNS